MRDYTPNPVEPTLPDSVAKRLPHTANQSFYYIHKPLRWQCIDGEWLPLLSKLQLSPGVNGVDAQGGAQHALVNLDSKDGKKIPWNATQDGRSYLVAYPCKNGKYHCSRWERPRALGHRSVASETDTEGWIAWLRWLVAEGHVSPPDPAALEILTDVQRDKLQRIKTAVQRHPDLAPRVAAEEKRLADMQPKRRGRPPKAKE